jgi:hypothetical protein
LTHDRIIFKRGNHLIEVNNTNKKEIQLEFPKIIQPLLDTASSIAFPTEFSHIIDGREYILIVINQYSNNNNPTGQCGAGEEGTLYVLNINDQALEVSFSKLVQSCLKLIYLESLTGMQSPYASIKWTDSPPGIKILWEYYSGKESIEHNYRFESGKFILSSPKPHKNRPTPVLPELRTNRSIAK